MLMINTLGGTSVSSDCDCIFSFWLLITSFKAHLTKSPIPFQVALATSRTAIQTATYSLTCSSCCNPKVTPGHISYIFLGALLPMLCSFYTKSIESIDATTGHKTVQFEGNEMSIGTEEWKKIALKAVMEDIARVHYFVVEELGKFSAEKHSIIGDAFRLAADALWEPLNSRLIKMSQVTDQSSLGVFAGSTGMC